MKSQVGGALLSGEAKALAAELVPYPENKEDKAELKEWDKAWVKAFKTAKSKEQDLTTNMMLAHLRRILLMDKHPLYEPFSKALAESKEKAIDVANSDDTSPDKFLDVVQGSVEVLYSALLKHYSTLREDVYEAWASNGLYEIMFQNLYTIMYPTYTSRFKKDDDEFAALCKKLAHVTPAHLGLPKKFWLTELQTIPESTPLAQIPYGTAVSALADIDKMHSHMSKVQVFVESAHRIYSSVEKYWDGKPDKPAKLEIAADEFLPLFSYVIIRAHLATANSTMAFINDYMTDQESGGEPGYYFATFQSAFAYVQTLTEKDVEDAYCDAWGLPRPDRGDKQEAAAPAATAAGGGEEDEFVNGELLDWTEEALPDFSEPAPDASALPPIEVPAPLPPNVAAPSSPSSKAPQQQQPPSPQQQPPSPHQQQQMLYSQQQPQGVMPPTMMTPQQQQQQQQQQGVMSPTMQMQMTPQQQMMMMQMLQQQQQQQGVSSPTMQMQMTPQQQMMMMQMMMQQQQQQQQPQQNMTAPPASLPPGALMNPPKPVSPNLTS